MAYRGILSDDFLEGPLYENRLAVWQQRLQAGDSPNQLILLVGEEDGLSGFVCARLDADPQWGALLDNLHVHPDHHRRGLGRRLVAAAAQWVREQRPRSPLYLWVYEANFRARAFYDSLGGIAVENLLMPAADGSYVQTLRYVWRELDPWPVQDLQD